jgi:hypothetical protein
MRGNDDQLQSGMFSYVSLEERIPEAHPLRGVRKLANAVLAEMSKEFDGMYAKVGRPSIPPERLFRALLLQVAAMLMYLFTGQKVTFAGDGAGSGGSGGILGGLGGLLGIGAVPVFGAMGGLIPGGAVGGWGTPSFIPTSGPAGGGVTSKAGVGILGGFNGWKDVLNHILIEIMSLKNRGIQGS